MNFIVYTLRS